MPPMPTAYCKLPTPRRKRAHCFFFLKIVYLNQILTFVMDCPFFM